MRLSPVSASDDDCAGPKNHYLDQPYAPITVPGRFYLMSARRSPVAVGVALLAGSAVAQPQLETIEVIGATPLGAEVDLERIAGNVQSATAEELRERSALSLADFMADSFASVFVNEAQSNPLQPDVQYRGYVGSPLLGLPQGIAVYQSGVRINEPFGDTVNWALIPDSAIARVSLTPGSNPLFGLNALGGAVAIETKDGFTHPGTSVEIYSGSFSRTVARFETGGSSDDTWSYFVTASKLDEDGWRDFSPTDATQLFTKIGWQSDRSSLDLSISAADTDLIGNGAAPIELLEQEPEAIFTRPDQTHNDLMLINLFGSHRFSETTRLTANAYTRSSDIDTFNGDDSDFEECTRTPGFICEIEDGDEELVFDQDGNLVPESPAVEGATVNRTRTEQDGSGFSAQLSFSGQFAGRENLLTVGLAYDDADIGFTASTELGRLDATRLAIPGGIFVEESFTGLDANVTSTGLYFSNVLSVSDAVSLTLSGRYNETDVTLRDRLGTALDGDHEFERFNPAVGLTLQLLDTLSFYAGLSESNRAPSPVELTCADEDDPCRLPNAFLADPPLEDVVAQTFETGLRGNWEYGRWHAGAFRTQNENDILFISAGSFTNEGYFDNVGDTRRQGIELGASGATPSGVEWFVNYTRLRATFEERFSVSSPNNPFAVGGEILVERGDRLPLVPEYVLKAGLRFDVSDRVSFGSDVQSVAGSYFRGDEGNVAAKLDNYTVVSLRTRYLLSDNIELIVNIDNVFDEDYETFGLFGEPDEVLGDDFEDSRFVSPGAPRAAWVGLRLAF